MFRERVYNKRSRSVERSVAERRGHVYIEWEGPDRDRRGEGSSSESREEGNMVEPGSRREITGSSTSQHLRQ